MVTWPAAAALLGGPPYALARFIGWPLPRHMPTAAQSRAFLVSPLSDGAILKGLAVIVWLLWAVFALSLMVEIAAAARGRPAPRLPVIGPVQAFAAGLIGATVLAVVPSVQMAVPLRAALASHAAATAPLRPGRPAQAFATALSAASPDLRLAGDDGQAVREPATPHPRIHRVVHGDDLWEIAVTYLGDGERWHEIFNLNSGKPQPDGLALTDPDLILPGWVLLLPAPPASHPVGSRPGHPPPTPTCSPAAPAQASSHAPQASPSGGSAAPTHHPGQGKQQNAHEQPPAAVELPSGMVIGLSMATAIGLAVMIARRQRRRWRRPAAVPGTAPADPGLGPALRRVTWATRAAASQRSPGPDTAQANPDAAGTAGPLAGEADIPPRQEDSSEIINVAIKEGRELPLDLASVPGIGFTGPGAADAIRAIMIAVLTRRTRAQGEVLLCGEEARQILSPGTGSPDLATIPGLGVFPAAPDALSRLETELIHRRRLLDTADTDLVSYRADNPDEHLPTVLVVADANSPHAGRLAAILGIGQQLGIAGIVTGHWPIPGATCEIAADGDVTTLTGPALPGLEGSRLFQITLDDASDILAALTAAQDKGRAPGTADGPPRPLASPPPRTDQPAGRGPGTQLLVLGPFQLRSADQLITKGLRRKAAELLTYLAIHQDGATSDAILDALWQDTPVERAAPILHAATTNIRKLLRDATGATEAGFIVRVSDHLRIDPHLIDVDLWRFRTALTAAANARDDDSCRASLQVAAEQWRGDLVPDIDSMWIDEIRETLRRDAADTMARLAELHEHEAPGQALAYLERAITVDRYQEALYQRIMRLQADLGRPDAARRTYQLLESRLTELDAEPSADTARLLHELLHPATR